MAMHEGGTEAPANGGVTANRTTGNSHATHDMHNGGAQRHPVFVQVDDLSLRKASHCDESNGICHTGEGETCVEGEHVDRFFANHLPSPKIKPSRASPKRAPSSPAGLTKSRMAHAKSFNCMEHLALDEEVSNESNGKPSSSHDDLSSAVVRPRPLHEQHTVDSESHHHHGKEVLEHTIGTVKEDDRVVPKHDTGLPLKGLRRSVSTVELHHDEDEDADQKKEDDEPDKLAGENLLVVFDMDHTMVGNLVALSDRDNVEVNIEWNYWPHTHRGLSSDAIVPFLKRGMLRPGLIPLLTHLKEIGATIVVYTHSEERWATKVCAAIEEVVGFTFIRRLFSRQDCIDGHPEFLAKKSLEFVVDVLRDEEGMDWVTVENSVMFDDDKNALFAGEQSRLVCVQSYDYWEPCQWDEIITEEVLDKNSEDVVDLVRRTVVEWGIAPPSYGKDVLTEDDIKIDERWEEQKEKKKAILMSYNKVSKLDRVMTSIKHALAAVHEFDDEAMESLPDKFRKALGGAPSTRRRGL